MTAHANRRPFHTAPDALRGMFAGRARITLVSKKSGNRCTFKISKSKDGGFFFVSVLRGPNRETDWTYVGGFKPLRRGEAVTHRWYPSKKAAGKRPEAKAIAWAVERLDEGRIAKTLEIWHEGRCCRCAKVLTVPESIEAGFGPDCMKIVGIVPVKAPKAAQPKTPVSHRIRFGLDDSYEVVADFEDGSSKVVARRNSRSEASALLASLAA